jgi:hypothetical protein
LDLIEGFNRKGGARECRHRPAPTRDLVILERKVAPLLAQVAPKGSGP